MRQPFTVRSRSLVAAGALTLLAAGGPAFADGADTVTRWYGELAGIDGLTVRHGAVTDEAGGKTIGRDLEVSFRTRFRAGITGLVEPVTLTIEGRWSMPAFMATDLVETADGYRAARIEIPEQTFELKAAVEGKPETLRAAVTFTDMVLRDGGWPRLPALVDDPERPVSRFGPLVEATLKQSWAEQTVATTETVIEAPGTRQTTRSGPTRVTGVVDGRIAEMVVENSETTSTDPGGKNAQAVRGTVRRVTDTGYDLLPVVRAFFGLPQPAPRAIVAESEVIEGITSEGAGARFAIERTASRGVSIGAPAVSLAALYDRLLKETTVPADAVADALLATLEVVGVDEVETTGLTFEGLEDGTGGSFDVRGGVRELRLDGWRGGTIGGFSMSGISGELPGTGGLTLDRFALSDLTFPTRAAIVEAVRSGVAAAEKEAEGTKEDGKKEKGAPAPGSDSASKSAPDDMDDAAEDDATDGDAMDGETADADTPDGDDADGDMADGEMAEDMADAGDAMPLTTRQILDLTPMLGGFEVTGLKVTRGGERVVGLDSLRGVFDGFLAPVPTDVRIDMQGLRIPAKYVDDAAVSDTLARFGVTTLDVDARLALSWDEATGAYALDPFEIGAAGLGRERVRVRLGNVPRSVFTDPENAQDALPAITLESAETSFGDAPALPTYLHSLARDAGVSVDEMIDEAVREARETLAAQTGDAFAAAVAAAVRRFLDDPAGTITVRARPKQPLPLAALMGSAMLAPGSIVGMLNLSVETTAP